MSELHRFDTKPIVANESDDSDSEIFRVKRPSSLKAERRIANDAMSTKHSEQQVLSNIFMDDLISSSCISASCSLSLSRHFST